MSSSEDTDSDGPPDNRSTTTNVNMPDRHAEGNGEQSGEEREESEEASGEAAPLPVVPPDLEDLERLPNDVHTAQFKVFRGLAFGRAPVSNTPFTPDGNEAIDQIDEIRFIIRKASIFLARGRERPQEIYPFARNNGSVILGTADGFRSAGERKELYMFLREEANQALHRTQVRLLRTEDELDKMFTEVVSERQGGVEPVEQPWTPVSYQLRELPVNNGKTFWVIRDNGCFAIRYANDVAADTEAELPADAFECEVFRWRSSSPSPFFGWRPDTEAAQFRGFIEEEYRQLVMRREREKLLTIPYEYDSNLLDASGVTAMQLILRKQEEEETHLRLPGDDVTNTDNIASMFQIGYLLEENKLLKEKQELLELKFSELASRVDDMSEQNREPEEVPLQHRQLPGDRFFPPTDRSLTRVASAPNVMIVYPPIIEPNPAALPNEDDALVIAFHEEPAIEPQLQLPEEHVVIEEQPVEVPPALVQLPEEAAMEDNVPADQVLIQDERQVDAPAQQNQLPVVAPFPQLPVVTTARRPRWVPRIVRIPPFLPCLPRERRDLPKEQYKYRLGGFTRNDPPVMRRRQGKIDEPRCVMANPNAARHADHRYELLDADWNQLMKENHHDPDYAQLNPIKLRDSLLEYFSDPLHRYPLPSLAAEPGTGLKRFENKIRGIDEGEDCPACEGTHYFQYCFILLLASERCQFINHIGYCKKCLGGHAPAQECYFKVGKTFADYQCSSRCFPAHHQLLCSLEMMDSDRRTFNGFRCIMD